MVETGLTYLQIGLLVFNVGGFRYRRCSTLDVPRKTDLGRGDVVGLGYFDYFWIFANNKITCGRIFVI